MTLDRRQFIAGLGAGAAALALPSPAGAQGGIVAKKIPSTGEALPVVGMGTWITFNVPSALRASRTRVLQTFFELGGGMVDSSPMYGSARETVGHALKSLGPKTSRHLFSADKIWTSDGDATREQFDETRKLWGVSNFDLMQVHNLVSWERHLAELREMKQDGMVKYIGVTTSHGRRHDELEKLMKSEQIDFVQLTYNPVDREVERRLLPVAADKGIAVIANRPFRGGALIERLQDDRPLPKWAAEYDVNSWPQLVLKWIISHPAITCAIPATSKVEHMRENMGAARGRLPSKSDRARILQAIHG